MKAKVWAVLLVTIRADNPVHYSDRQVIFCDIVRDFDADSVTSLC